MRSIQEIGFYSDDKKASLPSAAKITVEEYAASRHTGRYKSVPLSGIQIIDRMNEIIKRHIPKHSGNMGDIHVYRDHYSVPGMTKKEIMSDTPISALSFDRMIGTVDLIATPDYTARIALKFEADQYVELSIGTNVRICNNYNIFGGNTIFKTNKRDEIDLDKLLDIAEHQIMQIESKFGYDLALIHALAQKEISRSEMQEAIGDLLIRSRTAEAVIQQTDLVAAVDKYSQKQVATAWDLLQGITEVVRYDNSSGNATTQHLNNACNYVVNRFGVIVREDVQDVEFVEV